jgi:hypothetical protein
MPSTHQHKPCRKCGGPKGTYANGRTRGWYCESCAGNGWVKYDHEHRFCDSTSDDHDRWTCLDCQRIKAQRKREAAQRASATRKKNYPAWRKPAHADDIWQRLAHRAVADAKRHGLLPILDGTVACVDCGAPALEYDHRDYGKPFDVEPVCISCNRRRGTAIWPSADQFKFKRIDATTDLKRTA